MSVFNLFLYLCDIPVFVLRLRNLYKYLIRRFICCHLVGREIGAFVLDNNLRLRKSN